MMTNKQQLQVNNTNLASILSVAQNLPTGDSIFEAIGMTDVEVQHITLSSDIPLHGFEINHNLGVAPKMIMILNDNFKDSAEDLEYYREAYIILEVKLYTYFCFASDLVGMAEVWSIGDSLETESSVIINCYNSMLFPDTMLGEGESYTIIVMA